MDTSANNGLDVQFIDPGSAHGEFRAASLRNVAVTAPYMHDGRFATLRDVIEHYSSGAVDGPFIDPRMFATGSIRLNLSEADQDALEAFLNTLTDELILPRFRGHPNWRENAPGVIHGKAKNET